MHYTAWCNDELGNDTEKGSCPVLRHYFRVLLQRLNKTMNNLNQNSAPLTLFKCDHSSSKNMDPSNEA
jgi:hypothetical protein